MGPVEAGRRRADIGWSGDRIAAERYPGREALDGPTALFFWARGRWCSVYRARDNSGLVDR